MKKLKLKYAIEYVNRVAQDGLSVVVVWNFDEHLSHRPHDFDGEHFIECLKLVMAKINAGEIKKDTLTEGRARRGGTKPRLSTSKPNIKPPGQTPIKRVLKKPITYNDRVVGPS